MYKNEVRARMCPNCGAPLTGHMAKCGYCGTTVKSGQSVNVGNPEHSGGTMQIDGLWDMDRFESIGRLIDAVWDDRNGYQFCGIACGDCLFAQVVWASESYPTLYLYLDRDQCEAFMSLDISTYFSREDPINFPYRFQSKVYLTTDTMAAILTIFVQNVFGAEEKDLVFDIEQEPVTIDNEGNITFCSTGEKHSGAENAEENIGRTLLILLAVFLGISLVAFLIDGIVECIPAR